MTSTLSDAGDFTAVVSLLADCDTVSAYLTSAAGVGRWWGPASGDATAGGTLVVDFGAFGVNAVHVAEAGPTRVVWEPVAVDGTTPTAHTPEWIGTRIEFDLTPSESGTELRFRHTGLTEALQCWDDCSAGWRYFLASIERLAATGAGTPFAA